MESSNPTALTWIFSYQFDDAVDITNPSSDIDRMYDVSVVQYLGYHHVSHPDSTPYFRGIIKCYRPRSLKQVSALLPGATFKPLRGSLTAAVVKTKLRASFRVGSLVEYGAYELSALKKRSHCTGSCPSCCLSNKKIII